MISTAGLHKKPLCEGRAREDMPQATLRFYAELNDFLRRATATGQ